MYPSGMQMLVTVVSLKSIGLTTCITAFFILNVSSDSVYCSLCARMHCGKVWVLLCVNFLTVFLLYIMVYYSNLY